MRRRPPHHMAQASRRAAALWTHWARRDMAGCGAVLDEVRTEADNDPLAWENLAMALVNLAENATFARDRKSVAVYLRRVLASSAADEHATDDRGT